MNNATYVVASKNSKGSGKRVISRAGAVGMLGFAVVMGVMYLVMTNAVATNGYEIKALQQEAKNLEQVHQKLQVQVAEQQSLQKVQSSVVAAGYVATTRVEYVIATVKEFGVALK